MADSATSATMVLVGTLDTKGSEYEFLRQRLYENGVSVVIVDTGVLGEPGAEKVLTELPDFRELPPGSVPEWSQSPGR